MKTITVLMVSLTCLLGSATSDILARRPPDSAFKTSADKKLKRDIIANIMMFQQIKFPECPDAKPTAAVVVEAQGNQADHVVTEDWTITGCGKNYIYRVRLISSPSGGTDIEVAIGPDNPRVAPA